MRAKFATGAVVMGLALVGSAAIVQAQELKGEVIHQWVSPAESAGVKEFAKAYEAAGGTWVDTAIAGGDKAREAAISRVAGGTPPAAMLFNIGAQFKELAANGMLRDLEAAAGEGKWRDNMPKPLIDAATQNGKLYALPVSLNGANWWWFSNEALAKAGVKQPTTFDELLVALDKVKAAGLIGYAASGEPRWERLAFNAVLLGKGGRDLYRKVILDRDVAAVKSPEFRAAVETWLKLHDYVDTGAPGRTWNDSIRLVIQGKAAVAQAGTWANGEFAAASKTAGTDYGCAVLNPDQGIVLSGDVFLFPVVKDEAQMKAQDLLMKTFSDPNVQAKFAKAGGTIPLSKGADLSSVNICAQTASKMVTDPALASAGDQMMFPPPVVGKVQDAITRLWNGQGLTVDQFIEAYAAGIAG